MPSFRRLLPIALSLAATALAATCPKNWLQDTSIDGDSKCCYGNMLIEDRDTYCCVYDMTPDVESSSISTASTTSVDNYDSWSTAGDCFAKIPFTASDYSDQVSSASSKIVAGTTTIATNEATSTSASSTPTLGASSGTSSNTSSGLAASTANAAMPIATAQEIVLGGAAVVVGLFVL
ncbi:hypothetical protein N7486_003186 [Penicillium sp. IBT 16267x]|nr:hypothetical protein N7486_003186 [Penicillium sp. IBT 16267x]